MWVNNVVCWWIVNMVVGIVINFIIEFVIKVWRVFWGVVVIKGIDGIFWGKENVNVDDLY